MTAKRGLGRGFDSLIPGDVLDEEFDPTAAQDEKVSDLRLIAITEITPDKEQPRKHFDDAALTALTESIREHGVLQPLVVTPVKGGKKVSKYEIVAGERRWRAAKRAGLKKVPALIRTLSGQHKLELSLVENLQRADLNALETATAYAKLKSQFNLTFEQIALRVDGRAASTISNLIRLLALPDFAKRSLASGEISEGHARQLLVLSGNEKAQKELIRRIVKDDLSVRATEKLAMEIKSGGPASVTTKPVSKGAATETTFTRTLAKKIGVSGAHVTERKRGKGGEIVIRFTSEDELKKIKKILS